MERDRSPSDFLRRVLRRRPEVQCQHLPFGSCVHTLLPRIVHMVVVARLPEGSSPSPLCIVDEKLFTRGEKLATLNRWRDLNHSRTRRVGPWSESPFPPRNRGSQTSPEHLGGAPAGS